MADTLQATLKNLPSGDPTWVASGSHDEASDPEEAAAILGQLDDTDRQVCVLVYGLGLSLGSISSVLGTDPAVVSWRLRSVVCNADHPEGDARLETAIANLLAGRHPDIKAGLPEGARSWQARDLVDSFPVAVRGQLGERLSSNAQEGSTKSRAGLGIGVVFLLGLVVVAFTLYGAVLDRNPMLRGKDLVRRGLYSDAREAFQQLGASVKAQAWIAISWLSEGHFSKALGVMESGDTASYFGAFLPIDGALVRVDHDPDTRALLPRGLIMNRRPTFLFRPGRAGSLRLELSQAEPPIPEIIPWPIPGTPPGTPAGHEAIEVPYPDDWPDLPRGNIVWSVPGEDGGRDIAACTVISGVQQKEINDDLARKLSSEVPQPARAFLRGHYLLRAGLYERAAHQFAWLARRFPDKVYPRHMIDDIGQALGVDPALLLR